MIIGLDHLAIPAALKQTKPRKFLHSSRFSSDSVSSYEDIELRQMRHSGDPPWGSFQDNSDRMLLRKQVRSAMSLQGFWSASAIEYDKDLPFPIHPVSFKEFAQRIGRR